VTRTILVHINVTLADTDTRTVKQVEDAIEGAINVGWDDAHTGTGMEITVAMAEEV
jgi:hypothetical protein